MTGTTHTQRPTLAPLVVAATAVGFYVALFIVVVVMGEAAFTAAFPNPWRMLFCIPSFVTLFVCFWNVGEGRRV